MSGVLPLLPIHPIVWCLIKHRAACLFNWPEGRPSSEHLLVHVARVHTGISCGYKIVWKCDTDSADICQHLWQIMIACGRPQTRPWIQGLPVALPSKESFVVALAVWEYKECNMLYRATLFVWVGNLVSHIKAWTAEGYSEYGVQEGIWASDRGSNMRLKENV
jgi:hypothetical protein